MSDLPGINERVDVALSNGSTHPTRVEDQEGTTLHLAEPHGVEAWTGQQVIVRWITPRGQAEVAGLVEARVAHNAMHVWRVRATSDVVIHQRRRFVRARALLPVDIEFEEGLGLQRVAATSLDISEGGIQVVILGRDDVAVGRAVEVVLEIEGEKVRLGGDVLQSRLRADGSHAVVIRFVGVRSGDADRVRRFVFRAQLDALVDDRR